MKTQRLRDPVHDLIVFREDDEIDQLAWQLINTREFQRLRRIRQLGFSEFVYPGATHTRFSHCIGVFHNARRLVEVIRRKIGKKEFDQGRANVALCTALLHDLGHGPFSHTFEKIEQNLGRKKKDKDWSAEIVSGDTEVHGVLEQFSNGLAGQVSEMMKEREPRDILPRSSTASSTQIGSTTSCAGSVSV